jgi:hypothetical protein
MKLLPGNHGNVVTGMTKTANVGDTVPAYAILRVRLDPTSRNTQLHFMLLPVVNKQHCAEFSVFHNSLILRSLKHTGSTT